MEPFIDLVPMDEDNEESVQTGSEKIAYDGV